ncbi:MAG TPA: hypothetical protein VGK50_02965 [Coriobacteriia bacterium]
MSARVRVLAAVAASLAAAVALTACVALPSPVVASRPKQNERLGDVLSIDSSGAGHLRGTVVSWKESAGKGGWSGEAVVALPAYVEGEPAEVLVPARVDSGTVAADASGSSAAFPVGPLMSRLEEGHRGADVLVRKEGGVLRAVSVRPAEAPAGAPLSVKRVLELDAGGRGTYSGTVTRLVSNVSGGRLWIEPRYSTQGIEVGVSVPLTWDSATWFVPLDGSQTSLAAALRAGADPFSRRTVDIGFRRAPDGLIVESVSQR